MSLFSLFMSYLDEGVIMMFVCTFETEVLKQSTGNCSKTLQLKPIFPATKITWLHTIDNLEEGLCT